jgi:hypothetical protein
LGFLGTSPFCREGPNFGGWNFLDFLGFSRPNRAISMDYTGFSREVISFRSLAPENSMEGFSQI